LPTGITLTHSRARIIKTLIYNTKLIPSASVVGLTSTGLESDGVSRSTFNDNKKYLLVNYLIKTVFGVDKGSYPWIYYDATPQGVIALLEYVKLNEISKKFNQKILGRFFPLIAIHWDELHKIIGDALPFFLKRAMEQIDINNYNIDTGMVGKSLPIQLSTESINIEFSNDFAIKIKTPVTPISYERDFADKKFKVEEKYTIVEQRINELFTFLFYFSLINHLNENPRRTSQYYLDSLGPLSLDNVKRKNWKPAIDMNIYKQEDIISIVYQDGQLSSLIKGITDEIYKKFQISKSLRYIHDKII